MSAPATVTPSGWGPDAYSVAYAEAERLLKQAATYNPGVGATYLTQQATGWALLAQAAAMAWSCPPSMRPIDVTLPDA